MVTMVTPCRFVMWADQLLKYMALGMLAVIAVDRYRMVMHPANYRQKKGFKISLAIGLV